MQTSTDSGVADDLHDPVARLNEVVAKRIRNLEKRQTKLETYEKEMLKGKALTAEQKEALAKLPEVLLQLEQLKELKENFAQVAKESEKLARQKVGSIKLQ